MKKRKFRPTVLEVVMTAALCSIVILGIYGHYVDGFEAVVVGVMR